ncbi:hypothetical protein [Streptomyces sp. YIM 98790]|uniref:hypothetical protein n=1 Tax=Streptomyces sp. YIM 98790 TaxID=2689077 RepID=UPI00140D743C|nr:hypothetical protein [Streptomyces sp. YIM 98790]
MYEGEEWHATRAVYDGLVPRLTGVHRTEPRNVTKEFPLPPVVRVTGGRAAGKSRLIELLHESYDRRLAVAHADLADPAFGHPGLASAHPAGSAADDGDGGDGADRGDRGDRGDRSDSAAGGEDGGTETASPAGPPGSPGPPDQAEPSGPSSGAARSGPGGAPGHSIAVGMLRPAPRPGQAAVPGLAAPPVPGATPPPYPVDTLALSRLLSLLAYQLGVRTAGPGRPVTCHRLTLGLLLLTVWRPDPATTDPHDATRELREFIAAWYADRRGASGAVDIGRWLEEIGPRLPGLLGFPGLEGLVGVLLTTARQLLPGRRAGKEALRWWGGSVPGRGGDGFARLFEFVNAFRQRDEDGRREGRSLLVAALLADVEAQRGLWHSFSRTPPPLLLLDNVHTPLGEHLLSLLLPAYDNGARDGQGGRGGPGRGAAFRPVIVTTALGDPAAYRSCETVRHATAHWRPPGPNQPSPRAWLLSLGIPALHRDDTQRLFPAAGWSASLAWPVDRLSGGREGIVRAVAHAVSGAPAPGDGNALLGRPAPDDGGGGGDGGDGDGGGDGGDGNGGRTVGDLLLARLLPDPGMRDELALLAPALTKEAAVWLMRAVTAPDRSAARYTVASRLAAVTAELDGGHWRRIPWRWPAGEPGGGDGVPFVADPALRTLLLHRLRTRLAGRWETVQRRLRAFHNSAHLDEDAMGHGLAQLHHTLSLGRLEAVVRRLHHRLPGMSAAEWLSWVNIICAAPPPPPPPAPSAAHAEPGTCPACIRDSGTATHDAITVLVRGVWRLSDPLAALPSTAGLLQISGALLDIQRARPDEAAYLTAADAWPALLGQGVQAPELTLSVEDRR